MFTVDCSSKYFQVLFKNVPILGDIALEAEWFCLCSPSPIFLRFVSLACMRSAGSTRQLLYKTLCVNLSLYSMIACSMETHVSIQHLVMRPLVGCVNTNIMPACLQKQFMNMPEIEINKTFETSVEMTLLLPFMHACLAR